MTDSSPEQPTQDQIWEKILAFDPNSTKIPQELIDLLPRGANMVGAFTDGVNPFAIVVERHKMNDFAYSMSQRGLIPEGTTYEQFSEREIVEIHAGQHGDNVFIFDVLSGRRLYPEVPNIDDEPEDKIAGLNNQTSSEGTIQGILSNE